ncbi:MAG: hypothetical protein MJZ25_07410 [Fibrobacter sp.]|nr:hypothetical protein [Fibrobacter sp.]
MSKRILAITFLIIASFFIACTEEEQVKPQMEQLQVQTPKSVPIVQVDAFTAPASSVINAEKAKFYARASAGLMELGFRWSDRIDRAGEAEKIQILNAYNIARDQLCARIGLAGIAEYNWITTVALPDPKNKAVFESVGVKTNN